MKIVELPIHTEATKEFAVGAEKKVAPFFAESFWSFDCAIFCCVFLEYFKRFEFGMFTG